MSATSMSSEAAICCVEPRTLAACCTLAWAAASTWTDCVFSGMTKLTAAAGTVPGTPIPRPPRPPRPSKTVLARGVGPSPTGQVAPLRVLAQLRRVVHAQLLVRPSLGAGGVALPEQALDPLPAAGVLHVTPMKSPPNLIGALRLVLLPDVDPAHLSLPIRILAAHLDFPASLGHRCPAA